MSRVIDKVDVICEHKADGNIIPMRFRLMNDDGVYEAYTIKKKGGRLLDNTEVFDIYEGDKINNDEISIAFHLTFQEKERTLTDEEVMQVFNNIISSLEKEYNAVLRDK